MDPENEPDDIRHLQLNPIDRLLLRPNCKFEPVTALDNGSNLRDLALFNVTLVQELLLVVRETRFGF